MQRTAIAIIVMLLFFAGGIWFQIFLSKKKNKWLGLIIPLICFMFSIMTVLSLSMYTNTGITSVTETIDGVKVTDKTTTLQSEKSNMLSMLATVVPVFLISNIPTIIFLVIYFACREKLKLRTELDKMNIQDLE
jgi:TRAP-type C4-dicarboxylate transport system permease small subunit